jgi:hypothetical protein
MTTLVDASTVDDGASQQDLKVDKVDSARHRDLRGVPRGCHYLEFDSWWEEGRLRRFAYIRYNIVDGGFEIGIDGDENLYHIPVICHPRTSEAVTVWDLYVGVELDVLGRSTTLQRCSLMTAQWNSYWADRLLPVKNKLTQELKKYELKRSEPWLNFKKPFLEAGAHNLRMLMIQIVELQSRLAEYRPRLAEKLGIPPEMYEIESMHMETSEGDPSA